MNMHNPASGNAPGLSAGATATPEPMPAKAEFRPMTHDEMRTERDRLEMILTDAEGLVSALQIVLWEFSSVKLDKEARQQRRAIIAIGDALEGVMSRIDEKVEA